jgi:3-oxoadipate enol-lactonase
VTDGMLLVHAFPLDATMWEPQEAAFRHRLPVVAPHLPGFGGTEPSGEVMTMRAAADRCVRTMDHAGVERAVVCGLSMGGYVAFELWRSHRARVAGLVLANTRAGADDEAGRERRVKLAQRLRVEGSGFLVADPPPLLSQGAGAELWERVRTIIAAQPAEAIAAASVGMAERPDSSGDLAGIDVPALVVTGSGDMLIPPGQTAPMADHIPGAEFASIAGAGHLSNLEAPEEFNGLLEQHLRRCEVSA